MRRPGRNGLAESVYDVAPPFRALWRSLIGLYVPMPGDGRQVPNRAPNPLFKPLVWESAATPVYNSNGAVLSGATNQSLRCNITETLLPVIQSHRLAIMWCGTRTANDLGQNSGLFGLGPHVQNEPWHTLGFEWRSEYPRYDALTQYGASTSYGRSPSISAPVGQLAVAIVTRTWDGVRSLMDGPSFDGWANGGYSYLPASTAIELYAGNRWPSDETTQRQVWGMGVVWNRSLFDHEMLLLDRDPWALCSRWKRAFAGVNIRTLRPTGFDITNTGWSAS